jgi:hypothetical protein
MIKRKRRIWGLYLAAALTAVQQLSVPVEAAMILGDGTASCGAWLQSRAQLHSFERIGAQSWALAVC